MPPDFEGKLEIIRRCRNNLMTFTVDRELMYAFVACLSKEELCRAIEQTINDPAEVRQPFMNRLLRLLDEDSSDGGVDDLAENLMALDPVDAHSRARVDAALSRLYRHLSAHVRSEIIETWKARGTKGAATRWLKAASTDPVLLDLSDIAAYWRATRDPSAAKVLAYRGDSEFLTPLLSELVENCDEGWIVSKALRVVKNIPEETLAAVRAKFPATYAYICAKTARHIAEDDALAMVLDASDQGFDGQRGLVLWSLGSLGMWDTLEAIAEQASEMDERYFNATVGRSHSQLD